MADEKKKKTKQTKQRLMFLGVIGASLGFLHAAAMYYLREIYNAKSLYPSWGIAKSDLLFHSNDVMVLKNEVAYKILVDKNLLLAEQAREIAMLALLAAPVYYIGKNFKDRMTLFLFTGGLMGVLYHAFLYLMLRWPSTPVAQDVVALFPVPIVVPVYVPLLLSALALVGGLLMVKKA